ncbi:MAG: hypothetical protein LIO96_09635 [Lachnospiraceae bacterium]|nr:hypothetical protein [Lachnospiraceae bacterium]
MWTNQALGNLSDKKIYSREELFQIFGAEKEDLSESAFRWTLYNLQKEQQLFRVDYDAYVTVHQEELPVYRPVYSDRGMEVREKLEDKYPELTFVIFESVLLNEFLNHQIAQNTIYVQVEKDVSSYIFDELQQEYTGSVLYKPGKNEFERYWTRDCIVVLELISQAPMSEEKPHEMTAEKLLVDIVAEKSIAATFSPSEVPLIYANLIESYQVERRRLNRYAGRRGKKELVKKYAEGRT